MLIFNDEQRLRAGIKSLSKRCPYCSKALAAYPLILSDDAGLFVYHAACAAALATEMLDGPCGWDPPKERAASCDGLWMGTLVSGGGCAHRCCIFSKRQWGRLRNWKSRRTV